MSLMKTFGKRKYFTRWIITRLLTLTKLDILHFFIFVYRKYITAFIICPIVFYLPKFFEIRSFVATYEYNETMDCSSMFLHDSGYRFMIINEDNLRSLKVLSHGKLSKWRLGDNGKCNINIMTSSLHIYKFFSRFRT